MWIAGWWLCQLTLARRTLEPLSPSRSGSQHRGEDVDLPALIPSQRNPWLSPVSSQGSGGAEGMFVQNRTGQGPGHWQGLALPSATLKVNKSHPASRAHHSPAELAQHPPGCQPSPKSGLRAQVPGLAGLPAPSLYSGEAPGRRLVMSGTAAQGCCCSCSKASSCSRVSTAWSFKDPTRKTSRKSFRMNYSHL